MSFVEGSALSDTSVESDHHGMSLFLSSCWTLGRWICVGALSSEP